MSAMSDIHLDPLAMTVEEQKKAFEEIHAEIGKLAEMVYSLSFGSIADFSKEKGNHFAAERNASRIFHARKALRHAQFQLELLEYKEK